MNRTVTYIGLAEMETVRFGFFKREFQIPVYEEKYDGRTTRIFSPCTYKDEEIEFMVDPWVHEKKLILLNP